MIFYNILSDILFPAFTVLDVEAAPAGAARFATSPLLIVVASFELRIFGAALRRRPPLLFHKGASPASALPTPRTRHGLGGFTPTSANEDQTLSPLLSHRSLLFSCSCAEGCHLLFNMRRIASGETLKCSASTGVVNRYGSESCIVRMPSRVSGDRRFWGFHASSPNFSFSAFF